MILARDLANMDGILLLARERMLDERLIERIQRFEIEDHGFTVYVKRGG